MSSPSSFGAEASHPLAGLYGRWAFNFLVDLAHAVAHDFIARPQHYRAVPDHIAELFSDFRYKLGTDPSWPDAFQRTFSFKMLNRVCFASVPVRHAAVVFYQKSRDAEKETLLEVFREAAVDFRTQVASLEGRSLAAVSREINTVFESARRVFANQAVAAVFGLPPAPDEGWPLGGNFSGPAAELVDEMVRTLPRVQREAGAYRRIGEENPRNRPLMPLVTVAMTPSKFIALQRAAYHGGLTIAGIMRADDGRRDAAELIANAFRWTESLQRLVPDVVRAWKDLDYRARLTDLEWGLAPNPAGDAGPPSTVGDLAAKQTFTVDGEICCCSGDTDCVPTPQWWCPV
jgi:hypothetical protein